MRVNRIALGGAAVLLVLALAGTAMATPKKGNKGAERTPPGVAGVQGMETTAEEPETTAEEPDPGTEDPDTSSVGANKRAEKLQQRIEQILRKRMERFDRAEGRISASIDKVQALADRVAAAGGDVSGAQAAVSQAQAELAAASALEAQAVEQFKAVPGADDKKAAFKAARDTGKKSAAELRSARQTLHVAVRLLRDQIQSLKLEGGTGDEGSAGDTPDAD